MPRSTVLLAVLLLSAGPAHARRRLTMRDLMPRWAHELGSAKSETPALPPPPQAEPPSETLRGFNAQLELDNGSLRRIRTTSPSLGLSVEGGVLGRAVDRSPMLSESPYLSVAESLEGSGTLLDWRLRAQAAAVDVSARLFPEPAGEGAAKLIDGLGGAAPSYLGYSDPFRRATIAVTSLVGQAGRAYSLGVVDVGWVATTAIKTAHLFPNAAADATAAVRVPVGRRRTVSLKGGATRNYSPLPYRLARDWIANGGLLGVHAETARHATLSYRGPVLGLDVSRQWGLHTETTELRGSARGAVAGRPTELGLALSAERGPAIEFQRDRVSADVRRDLGAGFEGSLGLASDDIRFGNARLAYDSVVAGLRISLDGGDQATLQHRSAPAPRAVTDPVAGFERAVAQLHRALGEALAAAEAAERSAGLTPSPNAGRGDRVPERMEDLAATLRRLPEDTKDLLRSALVAQGLTGPERATVEWLLTDRVPASLDGSARVLRLLSSERVLEDFAVRAVRGRIAAYLDRIDVPVPVLNARLKGEPAAIIASAHTLKARPSGLAPLTAADQRDALEPWLWSQLARTLELPAHATREQVAEALLERAPEAVREELRRGGPQALEQLVSAAAETIRREVNLLLLHALVAAEQLDRVTVDGGRPPRASAGDMLDRSFERLDERLGRVVAGALRKAAL